MPPVAVAMTVVTAEPVVVPLAVAEALPPLVLPEPLPAPLPPLPPVAVAETLSGSVRRSCRWKWPCRAAGAATPIGAGERAAVAADGVGVGGDGC